MAGQSLTAQHGSSRYRWATVSVGFNVASRRKERLASRRVGRQSDAVRQLFLCGRNYFVCSSICVLLLCPVSVATAAALSASAVDVELAVRCTPLLG